MQANEIIFRVFSEAGINRLELPISSKFKELKERVCILLNLSVKEIKLFKDNKNTQQLVFPDNTLVTKLGLSHGDMIYCSNRVETFETPKVLSCSHSIHETCSNCIDLKKKEEEAKKKEALNKMKPEERKKVEDLEKINADVAKKLGDCDHPPGIKCLKCANMNTKNYKLKFACQHGPGMKCPNCQDTEFVENRKRISFDRYLVDNLQKCKGTHPLGNFCMHCEPPKNISFQLKKNCPYHPPYPKGICNKCQPPNIQLKAPIYRHVDFVSVKNDEQFTDICQKMMLGFGQKKFYGYLYGYFQEDNNYPEGVRAVVEAIWEFPDLKNVEKFNPNPNRIITPQEKQKNDVDRIASALGLECIGWITTCPGVDKDTLPSEVIIKAARLQEQYSYNHPCGLRVPKFVTLVLKLDMTNTGYTECYMISDLVQAMERDNILASIPDQIMNDNNNDPSITVRKPLKDEFMPQVFQESKSVEKFHRDFSLINLEVGTDKRTLENKSLFRNYKFPTEFFSQNGVVTEKDIKIYFKAFKGSDPLIRYANFDFLVYLSKKIDVDTAETYAQQIAHGFIDSEILETILKTLGTID